MKLTDVPFYLLIHLPNFEQDILFKKKLSYKVGLTYHFFHVTCWTHDFKEQITSIIIE